MSPLATPETIPSVEFRDPSTGTVLPLEATRPLGKDERCDALGSVPDKRGRLRPGSCGAEALVRAWIPRVGRPLLFCGHHFREHEPKLLQIGAYIHDERVPTLAS